MQTETFLEQTDRMLMAIGVIRTDKTPVRDMTALWRSGLSSSLLFSVDDPTGDATAEAQAQKIIAGYLDGEHPALSTISTTCLMDFQNELQMRSKVISAIEMLVHG